MDNPLLCKGVVKLHKVKYIQFEKWEIALDIKQKQMSWLKLQYCLFTKFFIPTKWNGHSSINDYQNALNIPAPPPCGMELQLELSMDFFEHLLHIIGMDFFGC